MDFVCEHHAICSLSVSLLGCNYEPGHKARKDGLQVVSGNTSLRSRQYLLRMSRTVYVTTEFRLMFEKFP